jgi:putative exosortase-associated protein (TIGR04073 family)
MTKRFLGCMLLIILFSIAVNLSISGHAIALESPTPSERFGRGMANIISSPFEIPAQMYIRAKYKQEHIGNFFAVMGGYFEGIPVGLMFFPWRLTAGLYDIVTCASSNCNECIISPEYLSLSTGSLEDNKKAVAAD